MISAYDPDFWLKIHRENEKQKRELGINIYGEKVEPDPGEESDEEERSGTK